MNNLKRITLSLSAVIFISGISGITLAATCSTTISQDTATCLSSNADQTFQSNYQTDYAQQKSGLGGDYYSQPNNSNNNNTNYSAPQPSSPTTNSNTTNDSSNNNNNSNQSSIRWF